MKDILISLKPYFYYLIGEGIKTTEVRKSMPKADDWSRNTWFYMSKDENSFAKIPKEFQDKYRKYFGKVGLKFVCDRIDEFSVPYPAYFSEVDSKTESIIKSACLTPMDIHHYNGTRQTYAWHISDLVIYDKPKELGEFKPYNRKCYYSDLGLAIPKCKDCHDCYVERPPQSYCYVEELG